MKHFSLPSMFVFIFIFMLFSPDISLAASNVAFESAHVYTEHQVYDSCFTASEQYVTGCAAITAGDSYNPHPVRVHWLGQEHILGQMPGWSNHCGYEGQYIFGTGFTNPAPGPDWEAMTYTFTVDCDDSVVATVNILPGSFHQLEVPAEVNVIDGASPSANWTAVAGADSYAVRLFPLDGNANPDRSILVYDSGRIFTTFHTLTNPESIEPGCYALCIEAWDYPEDSMLNRSRYFTRISVGDNSTLAFTTGGLQVYAEHRVYDSCFTVGEGYFTLLAAFLSSDNGYNPHPVRVSWDGNEYLLPQLPGWSNHCTYAGQYVFATGYGGPVPGPEWEEKTYMATVDCNDSLLSTFTPPAGTFHQLGVPAEVNVTDGANPSANWTEVGGADSYAVRLFPLDNDGNPDISTVVYDSGRIFTNSHTLTDFNDVTPGCYALCIESRDYLEPPLDDKLVNRSRYFTKISVGDSTGLGFVDGGIHVYTEHRVYDSCFTSSEGYFTLFSALINSDSFNPHPVRAQWDGQEIILTPAPGWSGNGNYVFASGFGSPPPGSDWEEITYTFTVDCVDSVGGTFTPPSGAYVQLDVPGEVEVGGGPTPWASWSAVSGADCYKVRLFPLNNDGNPDTMTLVYDSGRLDTTSHTLTDFDNVDPGCYALCIEAWDLLDAPLDDKLVNRSRYFTKISVESQVCKAVDFNSDGIHDISLFYPANNKWYIKDQISPTYGTSDCLPIPGDYDGDGDTDLAIMDCTRPDGRAKFYLAGIGVFIYGFNDWIPVPGDYNGDGTTDVALFDPTTGKWYVKDQFITTYGAGAIPVPGDYDGDGITDIAVFYPAFNRWYIKGVATYTYGIAGCIPVPADYNGDGITDLAIIDTSRPDGRAKWYIRNQAVFIYGSVIDTIPVPGDYDGDGDADPCLFYQNFGRWYVRNVGVWTYGNGDMIPLAGNLATRYAISQNSGGSSVW